MKNRSAFAAIAIAAVAGGISAANADIVVTFTYDDLAGAFTGTGPGAGNFSAIAGNDAAGEVSRIDGNPGSASFGVGFVNGADQSDFAISLNVNVVIPNLLASGAGNFTATDADGDTISGTINGDFIFDTINGFIFFNGSLSNVFVADNGAQDDSFDGSQLGSFQISGLGNQPFEGALTQITFGASSFFTQNFSDAATGLTAQIVPAPGALALVGMGGLLAARRRR